MQNNQMPIIDWELGMKLAGNKRDLAEDMLHLFIETLPEELTVINQLNQNQQYHQLLRQIHKVHSALCYTGLPRLKTVFAKLESELKKKQPD